MPPFPSVTNALRLRHPPRRRSSHPPNPPASKHPNPGLQGRFQAEKQGHILRRILHEARIERPPLEHLVRPSQIRAEQPRARVFDTLPLRRGRDVAVNRFGEPAEEADAQPRRTAHGDFEELQIEGIRDGDAVEVPERVGVVPDVVEQLGVGR